MSQVNDTVDAQPDHPDLPLKPPLVFLFCLVVGVGIHHFWPRAARPEGWASVGVGVAVLGIALAQWATYEFRRHKTAVLPWKPTRVIVDSGPFAVSRNPIYLGMALLQVGLGLWANKLAVVLMVVPAIIVTNVLVIAKEEEYLERKFGAVYTEYKARVRRWV